MQVKDPNEQVKLNRQLTGPLLTTDDRIEYEKNRDPNEPPMPAWWSDDNRNTGVTAAMQLGKAR